LPVFKAFLNKFLYLLRDSEIPVGNNQILKHDNEQLFIRLCIVYVYGPKRKNATNVRFCYAAKVELATMFYL